MNAYIEAFQSFHSTNALKVEKLATVITFLRLWHDDVVNNPVMSTAVHFITRECFQDVLLSCHAAISLIAYMRDNYPGKPCRLDLTGTDSVENMFSKSGGWVGNRRTYTEADLERNISHMIR